MKYNNSAPVELRTKICKNLIQIYLVHRDLSLYYCKIFEDFCL